MAIVYFSVGGGPFGFEEALGAASAPSLCLWTLLALALLWALPQALYVAELSTRFDRGHNDWVVAAMGSTAGFAHFLIRLCFGVLTNSVYAGLFSEYFVKTVTAKAQESQSESTSSGDPQAAAFDLLSWQKVVGLSMFEIVVVLVNMRGARIVGSASIALLLFVLSPFVVLIAWAAPRLDWGMLVRIPTAESGWSWRSINGPLLVSLLLFNLMGWDFVGNISKRSKKPAHDVPLAICGALALVVLTYLLPTFASASVLGEAKALRSTNLYVDAAAALWPPFGIVLSVAALCGVLGLGTCFMSTSSEGIAHGEAFGFSFKALSKRFEGGAPLIAVLVQAALAFSICLAFDFSQLVQLQMWLFCISTLLIAICFVVIRWRERSVPLQEAAAAGFRIKRGAWFSILVASPPAAFSVFGICVCKWTVALACGATTLLCFAAALAWTRMRSNHIGRIRGERFVGKGMCISVPASAAPEPPLLFPTVIQATSLFAQSQALPESAVVYLTTPEPEADSAVSDKSAEEPAPEEEEEEEESSAPTEREEKEALAKKQ